MRADGAQLRQPNVFSPGDDFELWKVRIRNYLRMQPATELQSFIIGYLSDNAARRFLSFCLTPDTDPETVSSRLRRLFGETTPAGIYLGRFLERKQTESESLQDYLGALQELALRAFPEEAEKKVLDQFRTGIHGLEARVQLLRRPPSTLDEAVEVATNFEMVEQTRESCNALTIGTRPSPDLRAPVRLARSRERKWSTSRKDCPYCVRFGRRAQRCGHNLPIQPKPRTGTAYRARVHSSTGHSPALLRLGIELRLPQEVQSPLAPAEMIDMNDFVRGLQQRLSAAFRTAHETIQSEQQHQKSAYDRGAQGPKYTRGTLVLLYRPRSVPGTSQRFHQPWQGPYIVIHQRSPNVYVLRDPQRPQADVLTVHYNRLKPYRTAKSTEVISPPSIVVDQPPVMYMEVPAEGGVATQLTPPADTEDIVLLDRGWVKGSRIFVVIVFIPTD
ncbi:unnamed protein product [Echinostoma caproni]|uniref:Uncharacterized protein n=1 Tax=Echinostoma caproni TaxID=27848 RepID=A0A183AJY2_9TREM|nr:unnamed protein product [Echinostoma caproni]